MNYRHAYHAGNFADIVKHIILMLVLEHLQAKDKPFTVIDTHAGVGLYDLHGVEAGKTGEWQGGIGPLLAYLDAADSAAAAAVDPALHRFARLVRRFNPAGKIRYYPGSPMIAQALLRSLDRLWLHELHPQDGAMLRHAMARDARVAVGVMDGYAALPALLPPHARRGLIVIDPPFERRDEFDRLAAASINAWARWPQGMQMLWYPVKDRNDVWRLQERLEQAGLPALLEVEFMIRAEPALDRFNGTGLVLVNTPWQLDQQLATILPQLLAILGAAETGAAKASWIVPPV